MRHASYIMIDSVNDVHSSVENNPSRSGQELLLINYSPYTITGESHELYGRGG